MQLLFHSDSNDFTPQRTAEVFSLCVYVSKEPFTSVQQCTLAATTAPAMQCEYSGDMHKLN